MFPTSPPPWEPARIGLSWLNKRHYLGIGVDYIKDDHLHERALSEEMNIDWTNKRSFRVHGASADGFKLIIAGINQGHWQVDTFYAETFDTVEVMFRTPTIAPSSYVETRRSTRSYSIPIRFGWRSSHGRWDHLMGVSMSIGFIGKHHSI